MPLLIINTYVSLMYELKKIGNLLRSKSVGTWPSSYEKKNLPGRGLTKVEKHWPRPMTLAVSGVVNTNEGRTVIPSSPPLPHTLGNYCR